MKDSVKQYILSTVFAGYSDKQVIDNRLNNGFSVGSLIIGASVFDKLVALNDYLFAHHVSWYITSDEFPDHSFDIPCIRFFDDSDNM